MDFAGYYEGEYGTLFRRGSVRMCIDPDGTLTAITSFGVRSTGRITYDPLRKTYLYVVTARIPPFFEAITGHVTGEKGREVTFRGEASPFQGRMRFSFDFAGRALDVLLRRVGTVEHGRDLVPH